MLSPPHRFAVLAALLVPPLAGCSTKSDAPTITAQSLQTQILALEAGQHESERVMSHVLTQNAQLRVDLAAAQAENEALRQRIEALEQRIAIIPPAPAPVSEAPVRRWRKRTPVTVRAPDGASGSNPPPPASAPQSTPIPQP